MDWKETTKQAEPTREYRAQIADVTLTAVQDPWGWSVRASRGVSGRIDLLTSMRVDRDDATHNVVNMARALGWIE